MRRAPRDNAPQPEPGDDDTPLSRAERPSKSALKRQMHDLQSLGVELTQLPESRVAKLDLPDALRDALAEFRRTRSHEGRRRHLQFIGKLMRNTDEAPIREAIAAFKLGSAKETLALHEAERWREEMLASDDAITRWLDRFADTDAQQLRSLVRSARKDAKTADAAAQPDQRHGRSYRDLFQLIKAALAGDAPSATGDDAEGEDDDE
ncbi:ribosome biogenesis factor YjgA [Ideonella sp. DXS29W]|uniref:Dual-action ribosomal maturation protein DarP n=1 Tax=Ideonella lacteola TaxID=2984193 RepID=A0ABU9BIT7_9BURK